MTVSRSLLVGALLCLAGAALLTAPAPTEASAQGTPPNEYPCPGENTGKAICTKKGAMVKKWVCETKAGTQGISSDRDEALRKACLPAAPPGN